MSKSLSLRPRHSVSSPMLSRVMPGSGPVSSRSSPRIRLSSVDLPAFGRPSTAMRSGFAGSSSLPSSSSPRTSGSASSSSSGSSRAERGSASTKRIIEFAEAFAVLGGKGDRIAEAEAEGLIGAVAPRHALGLVGDDDDRLAGAAHRRGEMAVGGGDPGARVDDEEDRVAVEQRGLGLRAHAAGERLGIALFEPGGVDDGEGEIDEPRLALAAVARHARLIVDERELPADQPVEQRRLADVRPADDRDLAHGRSAFRCGAAGYFDAVRLEATRPSQRSASCRSLGEPSGSPSTRSSCFARLVVFAAAERQRAERQAREAAIGTPAAGERGQRRRARLFLARLVEPQQRRAQPRRVAEQRIDRGVAGDGVEGGDRSRRVACGLGAGLRHLGQDPVAAGRARPRACRGRRSPRRACRPHRRRSPPGTGRRPPARPFPSRTASSGSRPRRARSKPPPAMMRFWCFFQNSAALSRRTSSSTS